MHYYNRNIGDYAKKAGRLSMLQHGAYTLLLDACYDREKFPTEQEAIEWTWASTSEEEQAVKFVLSRFFVKQDDGTFIQPRVMDELNLYKISGLQNRLIAIAREAKKNGRNDIAADADQLRSDIKNDPCAKTHEAWTLLVDSLKSVHEAPPNQEPITKNQEPDIKPANQAKKITLRKYLEQCKQSGVKAIPADHALFRYCEKQSLPEEFVFICWKRFIDYYRDGAGSRKLYTDWPDAFLNNVKSNYYKLWYLDNNGQYVLTTAGKQAQREFADHE